MKKVTRWAKSVENWRGFLLGLLFFFAPLSIAFNDFSILMLYFVTAILFFQKKERWHPSFILHGMILYLVGAILSSLFSSDAVQSFVYFRRFWRHALPFIVYFALLKRSEETFFRLLFFTSCCISVYGIVQFFTGIDILRPADQKYLQHDSLWFAVGTFSHHLTFGGVLLILFPFFLSPAFSKAFTLKERKIHCVGGMFIALAAIMSMGRSIWLGLIVAFLVLLFFSYRKLSLILILLGSITVLGLFWVGEERLKQSSIQKYPLGNRLISVLSPQDNRDRILMWKAGWRVIKDHPWLGVGPNRSMDIQPYYEAISQETGHNFQHSAGAGVHNLYLQIWINFGLLGLLGYLLWWMSLLVAGYFTSVRKKAHELKSYAYLNGAMAGLCGSMVGGFFENNFWDAEVQTTIFIMMGSILLLIQRIRAVTKFK